MRAKAPPASLAAIAAALREARSVAVLSHVNPDGDAIGSQVGLGLALQAMGKPVTLLNEDGCPENYAFLPGTGKLQTKQIVANLVLGLLRRPKMIFVPIAQCRNFARTALLRPSCPRWRFRRCRDTRRCG